MVVAQLPHPSTSTIHHPPYHGEGACLVWALHPAGPALQTQPPNSCHLPLLARAQVSIIRHTIPWGGGGPSQRNSPLSSRPSTGRSTSSLLPSNVVSHGTGKHLITYTTMDGGGGVSSQGNSPVSIWPSTVISTSSLLSSKVVSPGTGKHLTI